VRISVADSGRGIPPESLAHIFDPFVRVNAGSPVSGSGIGLAICRGLVEAHGGTIEVASRYGEGTTVTFELPVDPLSGRDAA
jgi:signal transduction histidine kinase